MLHDLEAAHDAQAGEQGADTKESGSPTHSKAAASSSAHHTQHAFASDKGHEGETHEEEVHRHQCVLALGFAETISDFPSLQQNWRSQGQPPPRRPLGGDEGAYPSAAARAWRGA